MEPERKGRICVTCGTNYKFCPNCSVDAHKPIWMVVYCSERCKKVYDILVSWENKEISDNEALSQLSEIDLKDAKFVPETEEQINRLKKAVESAEAAEKVDNFQQNNKSYKKKR